MSEVEKLENELSECLQTTATYYSCKNLVYMEILGVIYSTYMTFFTDHTAIFTIPGSVVLGVWCVCWLTWLVLLARSIHNIWKYKTKCSHGEVDLIIEKLKRTI